MPEAKSRFVGLELSSKLNKPTMLLISTLSIEVDFQANDRTKRQQVELEVMESGNSSSSRVFLTAVQKLSTYTGKNSWSRIWHESYHEITLCIYREIYHTRSYTYITVCSTVCANQLTPLRETTPPVFLFHCTRRSQRFSAYAQVLIMPQWRSTMNSAIRRR